MYNVLVRMRRPRNDKDEEEMIAMKISNNSLTINGKTFSFDSVAVEATHVRPSQRYIWQLMGAPLLENYETWERLVRCGVRPKHCWIESISINQQAVCGTSFYGSKTRMLIDNSSISVCVTIPFLRFTINRLQIYWILIKELFSFSIGETCSEDYCCIRGLRCETCTTYDNNLTWMDANSIVHPNFQGLRGFFCIMDFSRDLH